MDPVQRMAALVAAVGSQTLTATPTPRASVQSHLEPAALAGALQAVGAHLTGLESEAATNAGEPFSKRMALDLVAAARQAAEDAQAIERAAAALARVKGATVRELSEATGISERAANDRYRRISVLDPRDLSAADVEFVRWDPGRNPSQQELCHDPNPDS